MLPPPIFAVFANPLMLWGLGAASLPILIHLLNKRKFREVPWAAMRFLMSAIQKNQRRVKIEQWLLLAIRTLIIILVVTAMAKPFLEQMGAVDLFQGQTRHWVLVLDGSLSMDYRVAEAQRFEQAKEIARRLVKDARRADAISVVLMADPPKVIIKEPAINKEAVDSEIAAITLPHGGTDLTATFRKIDEVLESSSIPRKEVVFLTDLQKASWQRPDLKGNDDGLKTILARLESKRARSQVIDLGAAGGKNRAVVSLAIDPPIVTVGAPVVAKATVKNFGREPSDIKVRLSIGDQIVEEQSIRLGAGMDETVGFRTRFPAAGTTPLVVSIDDDALKLDDARRIVVPVRESVNILLVDGDPKSEAFRSETDFLAQALNPDLDPSADPSEASAIHTTVVPEARLSLEDLGTYDAVVLCNVASFTEAQVSALEAFMKQGGGLVVFAGDQVQPDNYDRLLYKDGKGLLPAAYGATVGDPAKQETPFGFDPLGFKHPIISDFADTTAGEQASVTGVKTSRYLKLKMPKDSTARVALGFTNGDVAVVEAPRHRGRVVQVATSADRDWTTWPLHPSFPPVMEQIVLLAASGKFEDRNVRVGQPLLQAFPPTATGAEAGVTRPGGKKAATKLRSAGDVSQFTFDDTDLSGVYNVEIGSPLNLKTAFAANPDPIESDPAKLDENGLKQAVPNWKFFYDNDWHGLEKNATSLGARGEIHRPLLWTVLILLLVESVLGWWFGHYR